MSQGPDDDAELLDEASGSGGGGGVRWLLLLLVVPIVAVVVLQLAPDQDPSTAPTPTSSSPPSASDRSATESSSRTTDEAGGGTGDAQSTGKRPKVTDVGHPLLGITGDWDLFARGDDVVVRIEPGRGRVTTTGIPLMDSSGPVTFLATAEGAMVRPLDNVPGYLVPDGKPARQVPDAFAGMVVPGPDPGHFWVSASPGAGHDSVRLVGLDGKQDGPEVDVSPNSGGWILPDGGGYPLVSLIGGVYDVQVDGLHRITTGAVEAVGPSGWLVVECDDRHRCARKVIDRATGERTPVPDHGRERLGGNETIGLSGLIAPDGSAAVVPSVTHGRLRLLLIDLSSGRTRTLQDLSTDMSSNAGIGAVWSPDSAWLFLVDDNGQLVAVDPDSLCVRPLGVKLPDVSQLVVRPAG